MSNVWKRVQFREKNVGVAQVLTSFLWELLIWSRKMHPISRHKHPFPSPLIHNTPSHYFFHIYFKSKSFIRYYVKLILFSGYDWQLGLSLIFRVLISSTCKLTLAYPDHPLVGMTNITPFHNLKKKTYKILRNNFLQKM